MSIPDILGVLRGAQIVIKAGLQMQESLLKSFVQDSNLKTIAENCVNNLTKLTPPDLSKGPEEILRVLKDSGNGLYAAINNVDHISVKPNFTKGMSIESPSTKSATKFHKITLTPNDQKLLKKLDEKYREKFNTATVETQPSKKKNVEKNTDDKFKKR